MKNSKTGHSHYLQNSIYATAVTEANTSDEPMGSCQLDSKMSAKKPPFSSISITLSANHEDAFKDDNNQGPDPLSDSEASII